LDSKKSKILEVEDDRIVCPVSAFSFLVRGFRDFCTELRCCFHCPKQKSPRCRKRSACGRGEFPVEDCEVHPLLWREAKEIFFNETIFERLFDTRSLSSSYVSFVARVKALIEDKRNRNSKLLMKDDETALLGFQKEKEILKDKEEVS